MRIKHMFMARKNKHKFFVKIKLIKYDIDFCIKVFYSNLPFL